jgi:hypothetical protein
VQLQHAAAPLDEGLHCANGSESAVNLAMVRCPYGYDMHAVSNRSFRVTEEYRLKNSYATANSVRTHNLPPLTTVHLSAQMYSGQGRQVISTIRLASLQGRTVRVQHVRTVKVLDFGVNSAESNRGLFP